MKTLAWYIVFGTARPYIILETKPEQTAQPRRNFWQNVRPSSAVCAEVSSSLGASTGKVAAINTTVQARRSCSIILNWFLLLFLLFAWEVVHLGDSSQRTNQRWNEINCISLPFVTKYRPIFRYVVATKCRNEMHEVGIFDVTEEVMSLLLDKIFVYLYFNDHHMLLVIIESVIRKISWK